MVQASRLHMQPRRLHHNGEPRRFEAVGFASEPASADMPLGRIPLAERIYRWKAERQTRFSSIFFS